MTGDLPSLLGAAPNEPGTGTLDAPAFAGAPTEEPCRCGKHGSGGCPGLAEVPVLVGFREGESRGQFQNYCCPGCWRNCRPEEQREEFERERDLSEQQAYAAFLTGRWERAVDDLRDRIPPEFRDVRSTHPAIADRIAQIRAVRQAESAHAHAIQLRSLEPTLPRPAEITVRPQGLLAVGAVGRGKTHLAYSLLHALVDERLVEPSRCFVGTEDDLFAAPARGRFADYEQSLMSTLARGQFDLVLIDDLCRGTWAGGPEARSRVLGNVFEYAMTHRKILIATSNAMIVKGANPIEADLGEAAWSRLKRLTCADDGTGAAFFTADMPDYRNPR